LKNMALKILIIDDEKNIRNVFRLLLEDKGYEVEEAETGRAGLEQTLRFSPEVVLLDMNLPDMSGLEVLAEIRQAAPRVQTIIITAFGTIRNAVEATKLGAYAFLEKPVDNEELLLILSRLLEVKRLQAEVENLRSELHGRYRFSNIVGVSGRMNSIFQLMHRISRVDGTVLITGESGTGKELVARAVHFSSRRKDGPFIVVNCGAIPKDLIESEFFGHAKGAFTDAKTDKTGRFELAHNGTIFLDEVGELSPDAQVKLLRALGEKEIIKVGGTKIIPVDVRVIAATNKNLEAAVRVGAFREDLYWRLAVLSIHLPPLRERREDIPILVEHLIPKYEAELNKNIKGVSGPALALLTEYSWPGNVRELESVIYEAMVLSDADSLDIGSLPLRIRNPAAGHTDPAPKTSLSLNESVRSVTEKTERDLILRALGEAGGNRTRAARNLGISRKTLFNKVMALKIRYPE